MRTKTEEQQVTLESKDRTAELINNAIVNAKEKKRGSADRAAISLIGSAYKNYLANTTQIEERYGADVHPQLITKNGKPVIASMDETVLVLYVLLKMLTDDSDNRHVLPSEYNERELHFTVKQWPVAEGRSRAENYKHKAWQKFVTAAVAALKKAIPAADFSAWLGAEANQEQSLNESTDTHPSIETAPAPAVSTDDEVTNEPGPDNTELPAEEGEPLIAPQTIDFNDWPTAPKALNKLIKQLSEMYQYGMKLKSDAPEKSEAITSLAVTLFENLKNHYTSGSNLNRDAHKDFTFNFKRTLHAHDELMDSHRKYWKVIVANTALAFTGIGTFAVFISLALRGHGFFNQTKSHQMVEELNKEINDVIPIK